MTTHIQVTCKTCGSKLRAPLSMIGRTGNCPNCKSIVKLEDSPSSSSRSASTFPPEIKPKSQFESYRQTSETHALGAEGKEDNEAAESNQARGRTARKEPYSQERIQSLADKVDDIRHRLLDLHDRMNEAAVEEMVVDGHAMLVRGMNQIENFIDNAVRSLREARLAKDED